MIIFRWSVWGNSPPLYAMLSHSIGTFRRFFGDRAKYLVYTDNAEDVKRRLRVNAEVRDVRCEKVCAFSEPSSTWRKWWPAPRIDPTAIELRIDADMFLLDEPTELWQFCTGETGKLFVCTTEPFSTKFYGNFDRIIDPRLPAINTGLVGQYIGADFSRDLTEQYEWWKKNVANTEEEFHDDQGAVVKALERHLQEERVMLLPSSRYQVVCPLNDPPVTSVDGLVLLHATYPEHPAFWQFQREIAAVSGIRS